MGANPMLTQLDPIKLSLIGLLIGHLTNLPKSTY